MYSCVVFLREFDIALVEVTALMCRINNNNTYRLSSPSWHLAGWQKVEWAVIQCRTCNTWNITEASQCIYTLICPLTGPAINHYPGNGLGHLQIVEYPNVHNAHKTEYMCYNQTGDISTLEGTPLKLVDKFTYLGSSVESTGKWNICAIIKQGTSPL